MAKVRLSQLVSRRDLLKRAAVTAGAVASAPILGVCSPAPAAVKERELHILQWVNFVREMDEEFIRQAEGWGKANKVKVKVERIGGSDLQPRMAASVQAKTGPDIIGIQANWAWLYADSLVDVGDVVEAVTKAPVGSFYDDIAMQAKVKGVWKAVPYWYNPGTYVYRTDWFKEAGVTTLPKTYDEFYKAGVTMKKYGKPFGQAMGHSFSDPNTFWYAFLWSHGGKEVGEDGKTVAINSKETLAAVERAIEFFDNVWIRGVLSWDDSSNNRAYLAEELSCTLNGASIYFVARKDFPKIAQNSDHFGILAGPAGRYGQVLFGHHVIMNYSKNVAVAKDFLKYVMQPDNYSKWLQSGGGYMVGPSPYHEKDPVWKTDPKVLPFLEAVSGKVFRWPGWPGPPTAQASEALVRYIVVDLFAKACSGEFKPIESVNWAERQLKGIYKG
jgi:multiple sugar transport system substrate-binding protein